MESKAMNEFKIPFWVDPGSSIFEMWVNHLDGWDHVFPYNAGSVTGEIDPVWTDPGNNIRVRRSEALRFGWME